MGRFQFKLEINNKQDQIVASDYVGNLAGVVCLKDFSSFLVHYDVVNEQDLLKDLHLEGFLP